MTRRANWPLGSLQAAGQTAVYWGSPMATGAGGRSFADPVELSVRWEQRQDLFTDGSGQESRSRAVVYVDQDLVESGYLYLGTLANRSSAEEGDPLNVTDAYEIRSVEKIPSVNGNLFVRKVWL